MTDNEQIKKSMKVCSVCVVELQDPTPNTKGDHPVQILTLMNEARKYVLSLVKKHHGYMHKYISNAFQFLFEDTEAALKVAEILDKGFAIKGSNRTFRVKIAIATGEVYRGKLGVFDNEIAGHPVILADKLFKESDSLLTLCPKTQDLKEHFEYLKKHGNISETKAARWAYRLSWFPVLGVVFFMVFGTIAFFRLGKGKTGGHLLKKGLKSGFALNFILIFIFLSTYLSGQFQNFYSFLPKQGVYIYEREGGFLDQILRDESPYRIGKLHGVCKRFANGLKYDERYYENGKKVYGKKFLPDTSAKNWWEGKYTDGKWTRYHENGSKSWEGEFKNLLPQGTWVWYREDGSIRLTKNYINGKAHGKHIVFYTNGKKRFEYNCKNGNLDGKITQWYENGQKESEGYFVNNKSTGKATMWYENGQKQYEGNYVDDNRIGKWTYFTDEGEIDYDQIYNDKGVISKEIKYQEGKIEWVYIFDKNGNFSDAIKYKDGKPVESDSE